MTKEELIKQHKPKNEEQAKIYEQNPPTIIKDIEWFANEAVFSELSQKDFNQVISRYLNNISVYDKNIVHLLLRIEKLLTFLLVDKGLDVDKLFKEDAKLQAEKMEQQERAIKEQLKNIKA